MIRVSRDEIAFFKREGYLVKRGVLAPTLMARAREQVWAAAPPELERHNPDTWVGAFAAQYYTWKYREVGAQPWMIELLASDPSIGKDTVILLGGIEVSWHGEHVGVLGAEQTSRRLLSANLHDFDLRDLANAGSRSARAPIVVWNHPRDPLLKKLPLASGNVDAIEISNGALHGMDLVRGKRARIVELAREHDLALLSGTDSHGWGYSAPNWTLLRLKGWRQLDRDELAEQIARALRDGGFGATQVVERATADPGTSAAALDLSLLVVPWRMLTELSAGERWMWLVWTWAIAGIQFQLRRQRAPIREVAALPAR